MDKPQLKLVRFFRTLRKSKIIPTLFIMLSLVFISFKLGQMFSHSTRFEYEVIAKSEDIVVEEERLEPWVETVSWKPRIQVMHNLLTLKECDEIIATGESRLTKSEVVGEGGKNVESEARTSHGLFFDESFMKASPLLRNVEYRIAKWTQIPRQNGESFYLLRYQLGQQYVAHVDYFGDSKDTEVNIGKSGDRIATVLVYLRTPEEGGETNFPRTDQGSISVPPIAGDAVLFWDFHPDGTHDPRSEHAGLPGTKFSITKWMRAKDTEFSWRNALTREESDALQKEDELYEQLHGLNFMK